MPPHTFRFSLEIPSWWKLSFTRELRICTDSKHQRLCQTDSTFTLMIITEDSSSVEAQMWLTSHQVRSTVRSMLVFFSPNIVHYKLIPQDHSQHGSSTVTDSLPYLQVSAFCDCIFFFKLKFKWKDCWFDTEQKIKPAAAAARKQVVWMELPGSNLKIARITSVVRKCTVKHPWS